MIQYLWNQKVEYIIDVKLGNADTDSYKYKPMAPLLAWWETINKDKHGKQFNDQQKPFSSFFLSVDVMIGRDALVLLA